MNVKTPRLLLPKRAATEAYMILPIYFLQKRPSVETLVMYG